MFFHHLIFFICVYIKNKHPYLRDYSSLEREFRTALQTEEKRFRDMSQRVESTTHACNELRAALRDAEERELRASSTVKDLTTLVQDQRQKIAQLAASHQAAELACADASRVLQQQKEEQQRTAAQAQQHQADAEQLSAKVAALEHVIHGLREERTLWSRELAAQGAALAAERGTLDHRVATLHAETEAARSALREAEEALRVKSKLGDDMADALRRTKQALGERERELKSQRDELERRIADQRERIEAEKGLSQQLQLDLDAAYDKKSKLKSALSDATAELQLLRKDNAAMRDQWQQKSAMIAQMEQEVLQLRNSFAKKEADLTVQRDTAAAAVRAAEARLRECDDAFRLQLEAKDRQYNDAVHALQQCQRALAQANAKVAATEQEMRTLLVEAEKRKQAYQTKLAKFQRIFRDLQHDDDGDDGGNGDDMNNL